jgi:hypothetical protein
MLELQKSGKGITSLNVAEYEATEQFTNNHIKEMVLNQLKTK